MRLRRSSVILTAILLGTTAFAQSTSSRAAARSRLKETAEELSLSSQESAQLSKYWTDVGDKFARDFKYESARDALRKAVQLDSTNEYAQKKLNEVEAKLGDRLARIKTYVERLADEKVAKVQESLIELENHIDLARRFFGNAKSPAAEDVAGKSRDELLADALKNLDIAREHLGRARDILRWMPFKVDTTHYEEEVRKLSDSVRDLRAMKDAELKSHSRLLAEQEAERRRTTELEAEKNKIRKLLDQAKMFMGRLEYKKAERICKEVLRLDPKNSEAEDLKWKARDSFERRRSERIRRERAEEKKNLDEQLDESTVPYSAYLIYPEDWDEVRKRESVVVKEAEEAQWKKDIRRRLDKQVSFDFVDTPLTEAVQFLQALTQVNIIIDPRALEEIGGGINITLRVTEMPLHLALKWILRLAGLDYTLKNEAVFVSTPQELAGEVELRVYDVRDLTSAIANFEAPEMVIGMQSASTGFGGMGGGMAGIGMSGGGEVTGVVEAETLADIIMSHIRPTSWSGDLGTSIEQRGGKLVVMQRPEVHSLISELLRSFRESQTLQVLCEAKFVEVRDSFLEDIGVDWTDVDPADIASPPAVHQQLSPDHPIYRRSGYTGGYDSFGIYNIDAGEGGGGAGYDSIDDSYKEFGGKASFYNDRLAPFGTRLGANSPWGDASGALFALRYTEAGNFQAQAILHALKKEEQGDLLMAPRLMMYNNQRAYVLFARQRGYVADYDVAGGVYDPIIKTILTGTILEVKPTVSHDRRYITLELKPSTASRLTFATSFLDVGQAPFYTLHLPIHLPNIQLRTVRATVTLPDGGTLLLSGLMTETKHEAHSGIPVLSDLPIIGRLFGADLKQDERMNLLIMVKINLILFEEEERKL